MEVRCKPRKLQVQEGLWWLPLRRARVDALRKLLLLLALGAALAGLEACAPNCLCCTSTSITDLHAVQA